MTWVDKLITEYADGKGRLIEYKKTLDMSNDVDREEAKVVGQMIADMSFAVDWMRRGRRPGSRRGTDKSDAYRYAVLRDMELLPAMDLHTPEPIISSEQKKKILDILLRLSKRERQCYLLHAAQGLSIAQTADELSLSKRSAQQYIDRARAKVALAI